MRAANQQVIEKAHEAIPPAFQEIENLIANPTENLDVATQERRIKLIVSTNEIVRKTPLELLSLTESKQALPLNRELWREATALLMGNKYDSCDVTTSNGDLLQIKGSKLAQKVEFAPKETDLAIILARTVRKPKVIGDSIYPVEHVTISTIFVAPKRSVLLAVIFSEQILPPNSKGEGVREPINSATSPSIKKTEMNAHAINNVLTALRNRQLVEYPDGTTQTNPAREKPGA